MKKVNIGFENWKKEQLRAQREETEKIREARREAERLAAAAAADARKAEARRSVMANAWGIANEAASRFGGRAVEYITGALRISHKMAKVERLEGELFMLNAKDLSGGRANTIAQNQIRENRKAIDGVQRRIDALKAEIGAA